MKYEDIVKFGGGSLGLIENLEAVIANKLPDDYRNFLLQFNGGKPAFEASVDFAEDGRMRDGDVAVFLGILEDGTEFDIRWTLEHEMDSKAIDAGKYMMVARSVSRAVYRMCLIKENYGAVFFDDQNFADNIFQVASSWSEFIDLIYEDDSNEFFLQGL